jgi:hypothetical protein
MRIDLQNIILSNMRNFEELILKRTKRIEGVMNETAFDNYLTGMSQKQINYNI